VEFKTTYKSKLLLLQLTDISDDGYLCLMADNGDLREDLKVPDGELGAQLRADFEAGKELLVSCVG
jgi:translation initiation factor 5A